MRTAVIVLVLVVVLLVIPNWLRHREGYNQRYTACTVVKVGIAIEDFQHSHGRQPHTVMSKSGVMILDEPGFGRDLPKSDGWENPLWIDTRDQHCTIRAAGRDGVFEQKIPASLDESTLSWEDMSYKTGMAFDQVTRDNTWLTHPYEINIYHLSCEDMPWYKNSPKQF